MQMDRTASNPLFGARGEAPIPEEYKSKGPRPPAAPPVAPPPEREDPNAHEAFERARQIAAKKREAAGRPLSFRFWRSNSSSPRRANTDGSDAHPDTLEDATRIKESNRRSLIARIFLPRAPSMEPPSDVDEERHRVFEEHQKRAREAREKRLAAGVLSSSPLARAMSQSRSFFSSEPPALHARPGDDDGDKIENPKGEDPVPVFKSRRERCMYEIRHRHAFERAMMAGFAVCLLWLTSLAFARQIVGQYIISPSMGLVLHSIECATNRTREESDFYVVCANRRAEQCNSTFYNQLNKEVLVTNNKLAEDREIIAAIRTNRSTCSDKFGDVINILDFALNEKGVVLNDITRPDFTTDPQCINVGKILSDQIAAIRAQITAEEFKYIAEEEVKSVYEQYRNRALYDREYLINATANMSAGGDALNELVTDPRSFFKNMSTHRDRMVACTSESAQYNGQTCDQLPTLMQQVNIARQDLVRQYENQVNYVNGRVRDMEDQYRPLMNFYLTFRDAMRRVAGLKAALDGAANDNGANGGGLAAFGWADIPDPSLGTPNVPSVGTFSSGVGSTDGASNLNQQNQNAMVASHGEIEEEMVVEANATKEAQTSWQESFFADYDPPPYGIEERTEAWAEKNSEYLQEMQYSLNLVARRVAPALRETSWATNDTNVTMKAARELMQDHEFDPLQLFTYDNLAPDAMLKKWDQIWNIAFAMDYVYRVLRTLSIIKTYISVSAVLAPPADVRQLDQGAPKGQTKRQRLTPDQALARIITHPLVNLLLVLIFLGIIVGAFLRMYLPFFNSYVSGCIHENAVREGFKGNGTMITRNAATIAFQAATGNGDRVTSAFIDQINVARELKCAENQDRTLRQHKYDRQEYDFNIAKREELLDNVKAFQHCLNSTAVDILLNSTEITDATNGTSTSFHSSLFHASCGANADKSLNAYMFDCSEIKVCDPECDGPPADELNLVSYNAGCLGEQYLHASILGTAFSLLTFILMNLSRWVLLRGLRRVFMEHFAIGEYSYLATTDEFGQTLYPDEVTEEGKPFKDHLRDELHTTIKQFKRMGYLLCLLAVALNLPWLIGLSEFSKHLQYQVDEGILTRNECPRASA